MIEKATFDAGCFWRVEEAFSMSGVVKTTVGFMGGTKKATYEEVCTGKTNHAEVCQVEYNTDKITYEELLDIFWRIHDPTQKNRQGPDVGSQYRSVIFFHTDEQEIIAKESKNEQQKKLKNIVTEIVPATSFYKAEEYHKQYFRKHGKTC